MAWDAIKRELDNTNLSSADTSSRVSYGVPAPERIAFNKRIIGAGVQKSLRIVYRDAANEILRMVFVEAFRAVPKVGRPASYNLDFKVL